MYLITSAVFKIGFFRQCLHDKIIYKSLLLTLKVRKSRNIFFKPTILTKNEQTNSFLRKSTWIVLFTFWKNSRLAKSPFKINRPLVTKYFMLWDSLSIFLLWNFKLIQNLKTLFNFVRQNTAGGNVVLHLVLNAFEFKYTRRGDAQFQKSTKVLVLI